MIIGSSYQTNRPDIPAGMQTCPAQTSVYLPEGQDASAPPNNTCKDCVSISPQAKMLASLNNPEAEEKLHESKNLNSRVEELSAEEKQEVEKLRERDQKVRRHEQAHLSAAGGLATGGANYKFKTGPDGRQYAVGGEVGLKIPQGGSPEEKLRTAAQLERAALAPEEPSASDRNIAAKARQQKAEAQQEINEKQLKEAKPAENSGKSIQSTVSSVSNDSDSDKPANGHEDAKPDVSAVNSIYGSGGISFDRGEPANIDMIA